MSAVERGDSLLKLKDAILNNYKLELLSANDEATSDITEATVLVINDSKYSLDDETNFTEKKLPLRIIYHCWLNKGTSAADYLKECREKQLQNVSFLIRTDLINWLSGVNETSKYIDQVGANKQDFSADKGDLSVKTGELGVEGKKQGDKNLLKGAEGELGEFESHVNANERMLIDHNSLLRGTKLVDFNYLVKQSEHLLVQLTRDIAKLKKQEPSKDGRVEKPAQKVSAASAASKHASTHKDPIIIIPSSASSVITMANIQSFLNKGEFISSKDLPEVENDILKVSKKFDITKQNDTANVVVGKNIRFNVVNSTRMFVKPEYWDRVVAIIVNGQEWQFDSYKWSNPDELFKHCQGVFFGLEDESVPATVQKWNVSKYYLDKNKTYRNLETCNLFWEDVKRVCIKKGFLDE